jgi:hypothetical protein
MKPGCNADISPCIIKNITAFQKNHTIENKGKTHVPELYQAEIECTKITKIPIVFNRLSIVQRGSMVSLFTNLIRRLN